MPSEARRLESLMKFEKQAFASGYSVVAGIDEAGRGPLAGPVVAAACILPMEARFTGIDDSKKLTPLKREALFHTLTGDKKVSFALGSVPHDQIDRINIYQATIVAMKQALLGLPRPPDLVLIDGMKLPGLSMPQLNIIKGDALSQSIAAASIIAKVTRDRMMQDYHQQWPTYGFDQHKGYATEQHLQALAKYGPCPIHRLTFQGTNGQMDGNGR